MELKKMTNEITDNEIRAIHREAIKASDDKMAHICFVALGEREPTAEWPSTQEAARAECARIIANDVEALEYVRENSL